MTNAETGTSAPPRPLRLWPAITILILVVLLRWVVPFFAPQAIMLGIFAELIGALLIILWWLFFSRAPWPDRLGGVALIVVAMYVTRLIVDPSIRGGAMGFLFFILAPPAVALALVISAFIGRGLAAGPRRAVMTVAILLACGVCTLIRTGGMSGEGGADWHWRWTPSPEDRLLAASNDEPASPPSVPASGSGGDWPGFRGPARDGVVHAARIKTDWAASPPVEIWRHPVGPGWSSFAVNGDLIYTQEQRGEQEDVSCYNLATGEPVWRHHDPVRFWESNAGAGPRGTPTLSNGRVYSFGATGILNVLDAADGKVIWSRTPAEDTKRKVPMWGFASSPLVVDDLVIVATSGVLAAYSIETGDKRWVGPSGGWGYSSPHLATIGGVKQVLLQNGNGVISVAPADGTVLWEHKWPGDGIVQPGITEEGDVLIGAGSGMGSEAQVGVCRVAVEHGPGGWTAAQRWTTMGLKPYFNDYVVHQGYAYGFDGTMLAAINLKDGERAWKGGHYGHGQILLLNEQNLLLVLTEEGELALVPAAPDKFTELARFPAIKGKTWNHPVLAGDVVLARNGEEMAAFRLPLEAR